MTTTRRDYNKDIDPSNLCEIPLREIKNAQLALHGRCMKTPLVPFNVDIKGKKVLNSLG